VKGISRFVQVLGTVLIAVSVNGCIFVPLIDAFKKQGLTESDRQALLPNDLKRFHDTLSQGSVPGALKYATNEARNSLAQQFEGVGDSEKVVDAKVANVEFVDASYKALADISVRYFKIPYYVVHTRKERQEWVFSVSDGWKIASRTVKDEILKR
jgi:hypothetical protein